MVLANSRISNISKFRIRTGSQKKKQETKPRTSQVVEIGRNIRSMQYALRICLNNTKSTSRLINTIDTYHPYQAVGYGGRIKAVKFVQFLEFTYRRRHLLCNESLYYLFYKSNLLECIHTYLESWKRENIIQIICSQNLFVFVQSNLTFLTKVIKNIFFFYLSGSHFLMFQNIYNFIIGN